jgi:Ca2+-dependent lipid-binding protein
MAHAGSAGSLKLTVVQAQLTRNTETFGKMDPYVKIETRMQKFKTNTINGGGKTPKWSG